MNCWWSMDWSSEFAFEDVPIPPSTSSRPNAYAQYTQPGPPFDRYVPLSFQGHRQNEYAKISMRQSRFGLIAVVSNSGDERIRATIQGGCRKVFRWNEGGVLGCWDVSCMGCDCLARSMVQPRSQVGVPRLAV